MKNLKLNLALLLSLVCVFSIGFITVSAISAPDSPMPAFEMPTEVIIDEQVSATIIAAENSTHVSWEGQVHEHEGYNPNREALIRHLANSDEKFSDEEPVDIEIFIDEQVDAKILATENATEIYLEPVEIDEHTYEYYNEDGMLVATMVTFTKEESNTLGKGVSSVFNLNWSIPANSYTRGTTNLDMSITSELYYTVFWDNETRTYPGFYGAESNTYTWFDTSYSREVGAYTLILSSQDVNFALKNDGNFTTSYAGGYWLED